MDTTSIITAVVVTGIFMSIFLLPSLNTKKTHKKLHLMLKDMGRNQGAELSKSDVLGDAILGIDDKKELVLFYKKIKDIETSKSVLLSELKSCKVLSQTKAIKSQNENFNQFEKISLQFVNKDKSKPDVYFEFYNHEDNSHLNFDLKVLEQWSEMFNASIK